MAKVRNSAHTMRSGRIGENSWYIRGGEQIVRQRLQNSNYGASARRSEAQQLRRSKWGNLVNFYKAIKSWQPKAYEGLKPGQTDYNAFMSLNANSTLIYLTRQLVEAGGAVVGAFAVSKGSLPSLGAIKATGAVGLAIPTADDNAYPYGLTVGNLSDALMGDHMEMENGDNLAFIAFYNEKDSNNIPRCSCLYKEVTIQHGSSIQLATMGITATKAEASDPITLAWGSEAGKTPVAFAIIWAKPAAGGLKVSSEHIVMYTSTLVDEYSSNNAAAAAVASYGVDADVPLMPGE